MEIDFSKAGNLANSKSKRCFCLQSEFAQDFRKRISRLRVQFEEPCYPRRSQAPGIVDFLVREKRARVFAKESNAKHRRIGPAGFAKTQLVSEARPSGRASGPSEPLLTR